MHPSVIADKALAHDWHQRKETVTSRSYFLINVETGRWVASGYSLESDVRWWSTYDSGDLEIRLMQNRESMVKTDKAVTKPFSRILEYAGVDILVCLWVTYHKKASEILTRQEKHGVQRVSTVAGRNDVGSIPVVTPKMNAKVCDRYTIPITECL